MPAWQDDLTISDDQLLWRRVHPTQIEEDPESGAPRLTSAAFKSKKILTSVDIASLTTPEACLEGFSQHSLVEVEARAVREAGCIVVSDPKQDNPAHAHIIGTRRDDGFLTGSEARNIANKANWVIYRRP